MDALYTVPLRLAPFEDGFHTTFRPARFVALLCLVEKAAPAPGAAISVPT